MAEKELTKDVKKEVIIVKDEILTRNYVSLFIVTFVILVFFNGLLKTSLLALGISISMYLFNKYVMIYLNPYIDKFLNWLKRKL